MSRRSGLLPCLVWVPCVISALFASSAGGEESAVLREMEERLSKLEQELAATRDELRASRSRADAQQEMLTRAGLTDAALEAEAEVVPGLSRFLEETQFDGWVTASYFWNFKQPRDQSGRGENTGNPVLGLRGDGLGYRYHPDHNSFQFDQAWFSMSRVATEESRGGFAADLVFGQTADVLGGADVAVYQAYAEYLAPLGPGVLVRVGRFASPLRVEPVGAGRRFSITEGLLASQFHPDSHTGGTLSSRLGPLRLMVGGANDTFLDPEGDFGDGKALLFGAGVDVSDTIRVDVNGVWGDSGLLPGSQAPGIVAPTHVVGKKLGIVDAVVRWEPSALLTTYVDFTYVWTHDPDAVMGPPPGTVGPIPGDPRGYGFAMGSHYIVDDRTAFSFRGEALWSEDNLLDPTLSLGRKKDLVVWAVTGTLDRALTHNVGFRLEARYDAGRTTLPRDHVFYRDRGTDASAGGPNLAKEQWTAGVEAYYRF